MSVEQLELRGRGARRLAAIGVVLGRGWERPAAVTYLKNRYWAGWFS